MSISDDTDYGILLYQLVRSRTKLEVRFFLVDGVEGDWDDLLSTPKKLDVVPNMYL